MIPKILQNSNTSNRKKSQIPKIRSKIRDVFSIRYCTFKFQKQMKEHETYTNLILRLFFLISPSWLENLECFDLRFGFLLNKDCIYGKILVTHHENPYKLMKHLSFFQILNVGLVITRLMFPGERSPNGLSSFVIVRYHLS